MLRPMYYMKAFATGRPVNYFVVVIVLLRFVEQDRMEQLDVFHIAEHHWMEYLGVFHPMF